jgi:solute carrier family 25 protein 33/36
MLGAVITAPLEVVKTRLQAAHHKDSLQQKFRFGLGTFNALRTLFREESFAGLYRGLGTHLIGAVPSRAIQFFTYGNTKTALREVFGMEPNSFWVHFTSSSVAGATVVTITQPIWLIKTRMQLQTKKHSETMYSSIWDAVRKIRQTEGVAAFYKGMGASYLGISESVFQFVLYERLKVRVAEHNHLTRGTPRDAPLSTVHSLAVASVAKLIASVSTYPHEVIRTRLREQRYGNKYPGVFSGMAVIAREEGARGLYGGMGPHLMRVVPNAAIMFLCYEKIVQMFTK